jgi:hypothetical protein
MVIVFAQSARIAAGSDEAVMGLLRLGSGVLAAAGGLRGVAAEGAAGLGGQLCGGDLVVAEGLGHDGRGHLQDVLPDR